MTKEAHPARGVLCVDTPSALGGGELYAGADFVDLSPVHTAAEIEQGGIEAPGFGVQRGERPESLLLAIRCVSQRI